MIPPTNAEIAMSMLEREIMNLLARLGLGNHPLAGIGMEAAKRMYGHKIKAILESVIDSDKSIDAGADIAKDGISSCIDDFSRKLKERLNEDRPRNDNEGAS